MGFVSLSEDISEKRLAQEITKSLSEFEKRQTDLLTKGKLSEEALRRDIEALKRAILRPLELIAAQSGERGADLGNDLLKLQLEIKHASDGMRRFLAEFEPANDRTLGGGKSLVEFMSNFLTRYKILLKLTNLSSQFLNKSDQQRMHEIMEMCENDVGVAKNVPRLLKQREDGLAMLYEENERLKDEIESSRNPGRSSKDAINDRDWDEVIRGPGMKPTRR